MSELLGADTGALDRVADSIGTVARRMQDIRALAQRAMGELQASWSGQDVMNLAREWDQRASPQLADASSSLEACAVRLRAQSVAQRNASGDGLNALGQVSTGMWATPRSRATAPPEHGSPADAAGWWRSLNKQQQQEVVRDHPDWIGNRDGVAFSARDRANRALLTVERSRLVAERDRLKDDLADNLFAGVISNADEALAHVVALARAVALVQLSDKLASLDAVEQTLGRTGDRQLILLDMSAERAQAAIARGDVDTADNVTVFVPGLSATVGGSMLGYDRNMDQLKQRVELESRRANAHRSAATVTWIGYQTPQMGWDLVGDNSVTSAQAARNGAAKLVPFLQGIGTARNTDAHLTLLGHSYGSITAGLALRQNTGVDDVVFFGSPGIGTNHVTDLKLAAGHTYYIEARQDAVGDLGIFGIDPSHLAGIEHASAKDSSVVDPATGEIRHFTEVTGHSSYLSNNSTSQYNISLVAAGLADRRVYDRGQDVGDVLSWPIPRTYR